jgi:hypothetical protein
METEEWYTKMPQFCLFFLRELGVAKRGVAFNFFPKLQIWVLVI